MAGMRRFILNHASFKSAGWHRVVEFLPEVVHAMMKLISAGIAKRSLVMCRFPFEIFVQNDRSLDAVFRECKNKGWRDESLFLMRLSSKSPLYADLSSDVVERLPLCESCDFSSDDGGPLLVCVMTDSISVSVPSNPRWDVCRLVVEFRELLSDGSWDRASEEVDNLAKVAHAGPIIERSRQRLRRHCFDTLDLWRRRAEIYPHLLFGPDVSDQLSKLNRGWLPTLLNRLAELDETARDWRAMRGSSPRWKCKVTRESRPTMNRPSLRKGRCFRSVCGQKRLFEWHARFGSGGRIHLRFDSQAQEIEVGYIGKHLPTERFR